jgi:hypothetical protein
MVFFFVLRAFVILVFVFWVFVTFALWGSWSLTAWNITSKGKGTMATRTLILALQRMGFGGGFEWGVGIGSLGFLWEYGGGVD